MKWLFRFAESQKNVDCFIRWVGSVALAGCWLIAAIILVAAIIRK
jgi:hypothetical protein